MDKYIWDELNKLDGFMHIRKLQDQQPKREFWILGGVVRNIIIKKQHGYLPPINDFDVLVDDRNDKLFEREFDFVGYKNKTKQIEFYKQQIKTLQPIIKKMQYDFFIVSNHFMRINYETINCMSEYLPNLDFHMNSCIYSVKQKKLIATDSCINAIKNKDINMIWSGVNCEINLGGFIHNNLHNNYRLVARMLILEKKLKFKINNEVIKKYTEKNDIGIELHKTVDLQKMIGHITLLNYGDSADELLKRFFNLF